MSGERDIKTAPAAPGSAEVPTLAPIGLNRFNAGHHSSRADVRDALSNAIRMIVLPRILAAHKRDAGRRAIGEADVDLLLSHVATPDPALAEGLLTALGQRGVGRADILLDLLGVAARRLVDRWRRGACTFADMTLAIARLRRLIRSESLPPPPAAPKCGGRILIVAQPGAQDGIDAAIVEDLFRSAGWDAFSWSGSTIAALERISTTAAVDIVAITISDPDRLDALPPLTRRLRSMSSPRLVGIITDGQAVAGHPAHPGSLGLDAVMRDARLAEPAARAMLKS